MSVLRKCVCCGKEYEFCPNCGKKSQPLWMVSFCSNDCKELFNLISAYNIGRVGKVAVQTFVTEHNITGTDYSEPIRKVLTQIEVKEAAPKKEMPKVEAVKVETVKAEPPKLDVSRAEAPVHVVQVEAKGPEKKVEVAEAQSMEVQTSDAQPDNSAFARSRRAKKRKHRQFGYGIN